jgi:hypothetical protein
MLAPTRLDFPAATHQVENPLLIIPVKEGTGKIRTI